MHYLGTDETPHKNELLAKSIKIKMDRSQKQQKTTQKWTEPELMAELHRRGLTDGTYTIRWKHLGDHTHNLIIKDLLLLLNGEKQYGPRRPTEEFRIPEDPSTELYNQITAK